MVVVGRGRNCGLSVIDSGCVFWRSVRVRVFSFFGRGVIHRRGRYWHLFLTSGFLLCDVFF